MGTYLITGIVQKIFIKKKDIQRFPMENVIQALQEELNLAHYVLNDEATELCLAIKPEILEENFVEFLQTQFHLYGRKETDTHQVIEKIKDAKTGENIIKLAESKTLRHFQMIDYIFESIRVLDQKGFSDHVPVNYHVMAFFMDGKIIMECYRNILHYFERTIRLQANKYPIASCLKTMITS